MPDQSAGIATNATEDVPTVPCAPLHCSRQPSSSLRLSCQMLVILLMAMLVTGCHTYTFTVKPGQLPVSTDNRNGILALRVDDRRVDKTKIGELRGGFGNKLGDIVPKEGLEKTLADAFKAALEKAGYTVAPGAPVTLESEIREFSVFGGGFTQGAKVSIRVRLRDKEGQILWEHGLKGEDGGMMIGISSYEKSMNVALTRLLTQALEEFTSEFFYQSVTNAAGKHP